MAKEKIQIIIKIRCKHNWTCWLKNVTEGFKYRYCRKCGTMEMKR